MSKVESFYWNKLSKKIFSFQSGQFRKVALITFSIKHCCIIGQREFSRKTEDSKIKYLSWNKFSSDNSCFELNKFFLLCLHFAHSGGSLKRPNIYCSCVVRQKEFSKEVEINKVKSFH